MRLEGAIEGADRAEAGVERDRQDRHSGLGGIAQRGLGFRQAIAVDEGAEIAVAELPVDQMAQPVLRNVELLRQRRDAQLRNTLWSERDDLSGLQRQLFEADGYSLVYLGLLQIDQG